MLQYMNDLAAISPYHKHTPLSLRRSAPPTSPLGVGISTRPGHLVDHKYRHLLHLLACCCAFSCYVLQQQQPSVMACHYGIGPATNDQRFQRAGDTGTRGRRRRVPDDKIGTRAPQSSSSLSWACERMIWHKLRSPAVGQLSISSTADCPPTTSPMLSVGSVAARCFILASLST